MSKNIFLSIFGITTEDTYFSNLIRLKRKFSNKPFAAIEINKDGHEVLHVGEELSFLPDGHTVEIDE